MKKALLMIIIFLSFISSTFAQNVRDSIVSNNEYFYLNDSTYFRLKPYKTNQGNLIHIVGSISYYDANDWNIYSAIFKNNILDEKDTFFVLTKDGKNQAIGKKENQFKTNNCKSIEKDTYGLLSNHSESIILNANTVYGNFDGEIACYVYGTKLIFSSNTMYDQDLYYIVKNSQTITDKIKSIPIYSKFNQNKLDLLYSVYKYLLQSTDYNYKVLENLKAFDNVYYPWYVSSIFQNLKVVCDGYVRTFVFILKYHGIETERVVGKIQPIDNNELNAQGLLHSWIKVDDKYFDPTFDDSDAKESYEYFNKSKDCFNLNHYTTGWVLFDTFDKRFDFIKNKGPQLLLDCPEITINSLYNDDKVIDFIKYSLQNYTISVNNQVMCHLFSQCDNKYQDKDTILTNMKKYIISYSAAMGSRKYDLGEVLADIKITSNQSTSSNINNINENNNSVQSNLTTKKQVQLSEKNKLYIKNILQNLDKRLTKYSDLKRKNYYKNLSGKIEVILGTAKLSQLNRLALEYLNLLIKEKL